MHRRVIFAISVVLFAVVAFMVGVTTDLHDRSYPVNADVKASIDLDFSASGLTDQQAFRFLASTSDQLDLGLVKLAPDLGGDQSGQVLVKLGHRELPDRIHRFGGEPDALVKDSTALENSFASGKYLVTGNASRLSDFDQILARRKVVGESTLDSIGTTVAYLIRQSSFGITLLAAVMLMASLGLYWLTVRSRGRALRVLAGASPWRIQYEDLTGFAVPLLAAALAVGLLAVGFVGVTAGWLFVNYYGQTLSLFVGLVVIVTLFGMAVMCAAAWPTPKMLAQRDPAVTKYRGTSATLKATTFVLVLSAVGPTIGAYQQASDTAARQSTWRALSDQVALVLPGAIGEDGFQKIKGRIGDIVAQGEKRGEVALTYSWTNNPEAGLNFGANMSLSLVNQRWLDLVAGGPRSSLGLTPVSVGDLPESMRTFLSASLPLWLRTPDSDALRRFTFYRRSGDASVPMVAGSGDLTFLSSGIIMLVPRVHDTFDDSFLGSLISSRNLVFTGLGPTQELLRQHQLTGQLYVKYVAEEGVLQAQLTAYFAWLRALSAASLAVALLISAAIAAFITATIRGRRNFPLRLSGRSWRAILGGPISKEWAIGMVLTLAVIAIQRFQLAPAIAVAALTCLLGSTVLHLRAAQWSFSRVTARSL